MGDLQSIVAAAGPYAGLGGIAIAAIIWLFRGIISQNIFPQLTKEHAYRIIMRTISLAFLLGLAGLAAWVIAGSQHQNSSNKGTANPQAPEKREPWPGALSLIGEWVQNGSDTTTGTFSFRANDDPNSDLHYCLMTSKHQRYLAIKGVSDDGKELVGSWKHEEIQTTTAYNATDSEAVQKCPQYTDEHGPGRFEYSLKAEIAFDMPGRVKVTLTDEPGEWCLFNDSPCSSEITNAPQHDILFVNDHDTMTLDNDPKAPFRRYYRAKN